MALLTAASAPTLTTIATGLLEQCLEFGRLSHNWSVNRETAERIAPRIGFTQSLLQLLEHTSALRFGDQRLPYLWNSVAWAGVGPPAGYIADVGAPLPSEVLQTLFAGWVAAASDGYPVARPLKAVLVHARRHGLDAAVAYLSDLHRHGFVPRRADRNWVLGTVLAARARVAHDDELASLVLPGFTGWDEAASLVRATPDLSWLEDSSVERVADEPRCAELLRGLVERGLAEVAQLRAATSLDEWVLRQAGVGSVLQDVLQTSSLVGPRSLGLRAVLGQLEEIYADTGGFAGALLISLDQGPIDGLTLLTDCRSAILAVPHELHAGLRDQRVLGPAWLETVLAEGGEPALRWRRLSITSMVALGMALPDAEHHVHLPARAGGPDQETVRREVKNVYAGLRGELERGSPDPRAVIAICERGLSLCPWSPTFRGELAIALDGGGRPGDALPLLVEAVLVEPTNSMYWQSLGVVLRRLDRPEEARQAQALRSFLEQRRPT